MPITMPIEFINDHGEPQTDENLLLQLVYGLCNIEEREENIPTFYSNVGIPLCNQRYLAKLLVRKLNLPIPEERVDEWIAWRNHNKAWVLTKELVAEHTRLSTLSLP